MSVKALRKGFKGLVRVYLSVRLNIEELFNRGQICLSEQRVDSAIGAQ